MLSNETKQNRYLYFVFKSVPHYTDVVSPQYFLKGWGHRYTGYNLHLQAFLSLCCRRNLFTVRRDFKIQWCDSNVNIQKTRGLITKTTTLQMHQAFLYIYLPFLKDETTVRKYQILCFMENVNKQQQNFVSLSELEHGPLEFTFGRVGDYTWMKECKLTF